MKPSINALDGSDYPVGDRTGVLIIDPIETVQFPLFTSAQVTVREARCEFNAPIDTTAQIRTSNLAIPKRSRLFVRSEGKSAVHTEFDPMDGTQSLSNQPHRIEVNTAPVKLYLAIDSAVEVSTRTIASRDEVWLDFPEVIDVEIGVRSFHDHPVGTVTTTGDPTGAMDALSYLGSALKTTSPERSFPTLRGHPPLVEIGDQFHAPDGIEKPDTGVRLELPAEYEYVYPAASLAYYLGAEVVPAQIPRLTTDKGFVYDLAGPEGYEETVARVLRQTFLLDCVVRTEGYYPVTLHEREKIEPRVDLDFDTLYEASLAERLEAYLDVPWQAIADTVPAWPRTIDIETQSENIDLLPYAAADLALVRTPTPREGPASPMPDSVVDFYRTPSDSKNKIAENSDEVPELEQKLVTPEEVPWESLDYARAGSGVAVSAHKIHSDARRRSLNQTTADQPITIHVVCNDDQMSEEGEVAEVYGVRDLVQFNVELHEHLSTNELQELLTTPADFLHYIGHVDDRGIQCRDGFLDTREVEDVQVKAFFLNACQSFKQGIALIESGSLAGVVTMDDVSNSTAMTVGRATARLLNAGFQLQTAMRIARRETMSGFRWLTVGNGTLSLCSPASGCPLHVSVESGDNFETTVRALPDQTHGPGTIFNIHLGRSETTNLIPMEDEFVLSGEELDWFLDREQQMPVETKDQLVWSSETSSDDLSS